MTAIDPRDLSPNDGYRLLTDLVVPRPIAWVSSQSPEGIVNLAPFSFFNVVDTDPMYLMISIGARENGEPKDTARNILANGEFVVNLVTEELMDAMNLTSLHYPPGDSELVAAGLTPAPSQRIAVPRVAEARASLECRLHSHQMLGRTTLVIGEVVLFNLADDLIDADGRLKDFLPVARMGSPAWYCRTRDRFEKPRP